MRIALLVYSLTRCTRHVADEISRVLGSGGHAADIVDVVPLVRAFILGSGQAEAVAAVRQQLAAADAIGIGSMAWCFRSPPGLDRWLREVALKGVPSRPAFVFASAGQHEGVLLRDIAMALRDTGHRVVDVACCALHKLVIYAPDTYVWYAPWKPQEFRWGAAALAAVAPFVYDLVPRIEGSLEPRDVLRVSPVARVLSLLPYRAVAIMAGAPSPAECCTRCGVCVRSCPVGAIAMPQAGGAHCRPVPAVNAARCLGCTRCVALCPVGAMQSESSRGRNLYIYAAGRTVAAEGVANNWSWLGMQSRFLHTALLRHPRNTLRALITTLSALLGLSSRDAL